VDAKRELVDTSLLPAEVEDPDLGVRHTTAEPGLGVGLVLAVTVATGWSAPHLERPSGFGRANTGVSKTEKEEE